MLLENLSNPSVQAVAAFPLHATFGQHAYLWCLLQELSACLTKNTRALQSPLQMSLHIEINMRPAWHILCLFACLPSQMLASPLRGIRKASAPLNIINRATGVAGESLPLKKMLSSIQARGLWDCVHHNLTPRPPGEVVWTQAEMGDSLHNKNGLCVSFL